MKTIFFVRHAKSSWDDTELSDSDRPLKDRGVNDSYEMADRLVKKKINPDLIFSSFAVRAIHTATIFAGALKYPYDQICINESLYGASIKDISEMIMKLDNKFQNVMIFGHNPYTTEIVNELISDSIENVPTCGVVCIKFKIDKWKNLGDSKGKLIF